MYKYYGLTVKSSVFLTISSMRKKITAGGNIAAATNLRMEAGSFLTLGDNFKRKGVNMGALLTIISITTAAMAAIIKAVDEEGGK